MKVPDPLAADRPQLRGKEKTGQNVEDSGRAEEECSTHSSEIGEGRSGRETSPSRYAAEISASRVSDTASAVVNPSRSRIERFLLARSAMV